MKKNGVIKSDGIRIVTIGGGTGPFAINQALKSYAFVSTIPGMWDSGGSTGILRDELGVLPPGDARQALVSLAENEKMRAFFNHRLNNGDYQKHAVGNILLAGLEELTGSFADAIAMASELLKLHGEVLPVTTNKTHLCLRQADGTVIRGEHIIGEECAGERFFPYGKKPDLFLEPDALLNPKAAEAIKQADVVVVCSGKLFSSVAPHFLIDGMVDALSSSKAKKVYLCNLMTLPGQTDNFSVIDHVAMLESLADQNIFDYVVYNNEKPSSYLSKRYASKGEDFVTFSEEDFVDKHYEAIGAPLLSHKVHKQKANDLLKRTLIRHDGEKVARLLMSIAFNPR
jgi:uncharacterized cofD-like protein